MKQAITSEQRIQSNRINRLAYGLYLVLVVYLLIIGDYEWAVTNLGIAMVFDPFDASVKWNDRPLYQRTWLLCHLTLTFAGFAFLLFR
jgi:hypothetical protein